MPTIESRLRAEIESMTRSERQLAQHVTRGYPVAALGSITALAKGAGVSTPTVVRLVQKLGYKGYTDFQAALRDELEERLVSPLAKHDRWSGAAPDEHILNRFAGAVAANIEATLRGLDPEDFDRAAALLSDPARQVFATGGRITHAAADFFVTHMKVIRPGVTLLSESSGSWPPAMIDMRAGDVLLVFDIRRYENAVLALSEMAAEQGAEVILITDQWVSPAASHAALRFSAHIEAPSAWDSTVAIQVLVETLLAAVQGLTWQSTETRMQRLEELYARARFFRRAK